MDPRKPVPLENINTAAMLELPIENNTSPMNTLLQVKKNADKITYFEMQVIIEHYLSLTLFLVGIKELRRLYRAFHKIA